MNRRKKLRSSAPARGYILLEALITAVILGLGLLGLAGLQAKMQAAEMEAYQRGQALVLLDDMASRITSNRSNATSYKTNGTPLGTGDAQPTDCTSVAFGAARDMCQWSNLLKGAGETLGAGGANAGAMIGARGCVDEEVAGAIPLTLRVVVSWQGLTSTAAPILVCGTDADYGDGGSTGLRRSISKTVTIPNLTPP